MDKEKDIRELSFEEILLDERLVKGDIWILKEVLQNVGGVNYRLDAKRNYELLIRVAKESTVLCFEKGIVCGISEEALEKGLSRNEKDGSKDKWIHLKQESEATVADSNRNAERELKTDCYLIGRYRTDLEAMGHFEDAVQGILSAGGKTITQYLACMIARTKEFYDIYDATQPILIYAGFKRCYNIYDIFSHCLGQALKELGQHVEYFDLSKQNVEDLDLFTRQRYKAVISMHYSMLYLRSGNAYIHDMVAAPKYHFTFDHPIWEKPFLEQKSKGVCVLALDGNYVKFVQDHYEHSARFLPPAGRKENFEMGERDYEVVFLGTCYGGGMEDIGTLMETDRQTRYLINRFILYMRKDLKGTPECAFHKVLDYYGMVYSEKEFLEMFYSVRGVIQWLAHYYRRKVIKTLLEAGITVHVFGDNWKESSLYTEPELVWHEKAVGKDALEVYARAKLSLNVMMWHKDGFTERIADSMLQKSVMVTDRTTYLEENFVNGEELLLFDLKQIKYLPGQIKELLSDEEKRRRIAENGYRKALQFHTWRQRAEKMLEFIEEDSRRNVEDEGLFHHNSGV